MFAFQLVADALGVPLAEGKARWDQAQARLKRQKQQLPPTTRTKPPGARQPTPTLAADFAAKALAQVLKEPLKDFFEKEEKLAWLREKVQEAGGDPKTVDAEVRQLLAEKAQREADALSLVLPGLQAGGAAMALRTGRGDGEVLGAIFDYLRWLGVEDVANQWNHWLREEFLTDSNPNPSNANGEIIRYAEKVFPGQHTATPFTNFPGFRLLTKLCLHKSKIAQGMYDQALVLLGQVSVGDQRLHEVLDANAAWRLRRRPRSLWPTATSFWPRWRETAWCCSASGPIFAPTETWCWRPWLRTAGCWSTLPWNSGPTETWCWRPWLRAAGRRSTLPRSSGPTVRSCWPRRHGVASWHRVPSFCVASVHVVSFRGVALRVVSFSVVSFRGCVASFCVASVHVVLFRGASLRVVSFSVVSFRGCVASFCVETQLLPENTARGQSDHSGSCSRRTSCQ
jgi:hypothetical protein